MQAKSHLVLRSTFATLLALSAGFVPALPEAAADKDSPSFQGSAQASAPTSEPVPEVSPTEVLDNYIKKVRDRIWKSWNPLPGKTNLKTTVNFNILQEGLIAEVKVVSSSGDAAVDKHAVDTLTGLSPVEPIPQNLPHILNLDFTFESFTAPDSSSAKADPLADKRSAYQRYPDNPEAAYRYGRALRLYGRYKEAKVYLEKAIELGYPGYKPHLELASVMSKTGQASEAIALLSELTDKNPDYAPAYKQLGDTAFSARRWQQSEASYSRYLKLQPDSPYRELIESRLRECHRKLNPDLDHYGPENDDHR